MVLFIYVFYFSSRFKASNGILLLLLSKREALCCLIVHGTFPGSLFKEKAKNPLWHTVAVVFSCDEWNGPSIRNKPLLKMEYCDYKF